MRLGLGRCSDRIGLVEVCETGHVDVNPAHVVVLRLQEVVEPRPVGIAEDAQIFAVAAFTVVYYAYKKSQVIYRDEQSDSGFDSQSKLCFIEREHVIGTEPCGA